MLNLYIYTSERNTIHPAIIYRLRCKLVHLVHSCPIKNRESVLNILRIYITCVYVSTLRFNYQIICILIMNLLRGFINANSNWALPMSVPKSNLNAWIHRVTNPSTKIIKPGAHDVILAVRFLSTD